MLLDLGQASAGSDEWLDAHMNPSHFKVNALLGQALYQQMMAAAGDPAWAEARRGWAADAKSDYERAAAMQWSIEQNTAIQADKLK